MSISHETEALLALTHTPGFGPVRILRLLDLYGSAEAVIAASHDEMARLAKISEKLVDALADTLKNRSWQQNLALANDSGVSIIALNDSEYPPALRSLDDPPVVLYARGNVTTLKHKGIGVVGTRSATHYGKEMASKISAELCQQGLSVISGLARGIDTHAHQGALTGGGPTLAVIGSGLANLYPKENSRLADNIVDAGGAIVSEFSMMTPPDRKHFPRRNRIIAALSAGVFVVEAPERSGAMITMDKGQALGRPLFALPGRVDTGTFGGNHLLIKRGMAHLVEKVNDLIEVVGAALVKETSDEGATHNSSLDMLKREERVLLDTMPGEELSVDALVNLSNFPVEKVNILIMSLLLKGAIRELPGRLYKRNY